MFRASGCSKEERLQDIGGLLNASRCHQSCRVDPRTADGNPRLPHSLLLRHLQYTVIVHCGEGMNYIKGAYLSILSNPGPTDGFMTSS